MRLPNQIRAVACTCWIGVLGLGIYFACEADLSSRAGVIREGSAGGTRLADPGAQDAPARLRIGEPHTGDKPAAKVGSPGFASESPEVSAWASNQASPLLGPSVARSQGVSSVPSPEKTKAMLREPGRGHYSQAFEGGAAWSSGQRKSAYEAARSKSREDTHGTTGTLGTPQFRPATGIKPGHHLRTLATYTPYEVTAYSAGCILPKFGPEPPPQPMASGAWPVAGLHVAADPSLAFGTVLEVVYRGLPSRLIVGDRGRAIRGRRLDLYVRDCRAARAWGRRTAYVREVR